MTMAKGFRALAVPIFVLLLAGPATLQAEPFQRHVLGIYDSSGWQTEIYNPLRFQAEMVLNHLGLKLEYHDLAAGLPTADRMARYRGIVVWCETERVSSARRYWSWLRGQLRQGRRVVLLGGTAPRVDAATGERVPLFVVNRALRAMGLVAGSDHTDLPLDIEVVDKDPGMVEFERRLEAELVRFSELRSVDPGNGVHLKLRMKSTGAVSDAVVTTPLGGLVMPGYIRYVDQDTDKKQWRIDPFEFFARALGVQDTPRPDCTTLNGVRIFYSHIDGDGIGNMSFTVRNRLAGEIVAEEILEAYAELPITVSVIIGEVEKETRGSDRSIAVARRIFRLPNVEPASHTYAHPLIWNTALVPSAHVEAYGEVMQDIAMSGRALLSWRVPGYVFDPIKETSWTCRYIEENLLPPGRACDIVFWSGNCLPDEETLGACQAAGLLNMNGGDARFDGEYPSYCYVTPLYRQVGSYYQIHSSNSNENTYTNLWAGPFGGYQNAIQTFVNTETPRRVSPINVYYHFYSGERPAGLHALKVVYDWVRSQKAFPVYASRYIGIVKGFISTRLERLGDRDWQIRENGACRTIRFDNCALYPDLDRSRGILGFGHHQNALYVFLDDSQEHRVSLTDTQPEGPYLRQATADVDGLRWTRLGGISFRTGGLHNAAYAWGNFPAGRAYTVRWASEAREGAVAVRSGTDGSLRFSIPLRGPGTATVEPAGVGNP